MGPRQRVLPAHQLPGEQRPWRHRCHQHHPEPGGVRLQLPLLHRMDARAPAGRSRRHVEAPRARLQAGLVAERLALPHHARRASAGVAFGHGTTNAFDEAAWLVLWQLGLRLDTDLSADAPEATREIPAAEAAAAHALVERRIATREPAAYLTGEAWLQGVRF